MPRLSLTIAYALFRRPDISNIEPKFLPWDQAHPRDGEVGLAVRTADGEVVFGTDDPVRFVGWLADNYPIVLMSIRLELAAYHQLEYGN